MTLEFLMDLIPEEYFFPSLFTFTVIFLYGGFCYIFFCNPFDFATGKEKKLDNPIISYKRANVVLDNVDFKNNVLNIRYKGALGYIYQGKQEGAGETFYAYKNLNDAINHPQKTNVLLEVVQYGKIKEHELGYVSTGQRVLQILLPKEIEWQEIRGKSITPSKEIRFYYNIKELYGREWKDQLGNRIIFAPLSNSEEKRKSFSSFVPTELSK